MATLLDWFLLATAISATSPPPLNTTAATTFCPRRTYSCGDGVDIRYPFWVDVNASSCGYSSLRLECRGGRTVLPLPSGEYGVTSIHYGDSSAVDRTITLFDIRVSQNTSCPIVTGRNLTLPIGSPPPLSLTSKDTNLTFYIDCHFGGFPTKTVPCLESSDGRRQTYVSNYDEHHLRYSFAMLCKDVVGVPVLRRSMSNSTASLNDIMTTLTKGFELRWRPAAPGGECGKCERAGGACGIQHREETGQADAFKCFTGSPSKSSGGPRFTARAITGIVMLPAIAVIGLTAIVLINLGMCGPQP